MLHIGTRVVVLNANFPPYTYAIGSSSTVVCVSSITKKGVGIGGGPKTGSLNEWRDPYAIAFLGAWLNLYAFQW